MADDTLRSFLVTLGWKSDESQQRKFTKALEGATLRAKLLGDAIEEMARKTGLAVLGVAENFEQLYYHAERTGASAKSLKAFEYAISQVGGSAQAAGASFETMAAKLRENPGNIAYLNRMGVELDANTGKLRFNAELAAKYSGEMRIYTAEQYRALTGMDENTFLAIRNHIGEISRFMAEREKAMRQSGFDPDQAAADAVRFNQVWRDLFMRLGVIGDKFYDDLEKDLTGPLRSLDNFLNEHQAEISTALEGFADAVGKTSKESTELFEQWEATPEAGKDIHQFFDDAATSAKFFATVLRDVVESIKWLVRVNEESKSWRITRFLNWTQGRSDPSDPTQSAANDAWISTNSIGAGGGGVVKVNGQKVDSSNPLPVTFGQKDQLDQEAAGGLWGRLKSALGIGSAEAAESGRGRGGLMGLRRAGEQGPLGSANPARRSEMMNYAMDQLRKEGVPEANLRAAAAELVGQADMESGLNPRQSHDGGTGYGIYGARLERRARMFEWLRKNGYALDSAEGQMRYMSHEAMSGKYPQTRRILMGATRANLAGDTWGVTHEFERPAVDNDRSGAVAQAYRAGIDPTNAAYRIAANAFQNAPPPSSIANNNAVTHNNVNQTVKVQVDGAADPSAVAHQVASRISRTATDLASSFQGAAQ